MMNFLTLNTIRGLIYESANCLQSTTTDGLFLANCSGKYSHKGDVAVITVPQNLSPNLEVIDLSQYNGREDAVIFLTDANIFQHYPKLQRIIGKRLLQFGHYNQQYIRINQHVLANAFKNLNSLKYLELISCSLTDRYPITLPRGLKTLVVRNNGYTRLSVQWCSELVELDANYNHLQSVPTFHIPNPPLTTLRMKGSPLNEMTVIDIAPLCELVLLELDFPSNSYYLTEAGACQCNLLKRWVAKFKIEGVNDVQCVANKTDCSKVNGVLNDARELRKKCPLLKKGVVASKLFSILKIIFFFILFLLLLAVTILYIIRHFHLREYWRAHHRSLAQTAITQEEGEGEEEDTITNSSTKSESS